MEVDLVWATSTSTSIAPSKEEDKGRASGGRRTITGMQVVRQHVDVSMKATTTTSGKENKNEDKGKERGEDPAAEAAEAAEAADTPGAQVDAKTGPPQVKVNLNLNVEESESERAVAVAVAVSGAVGCELRDENGATWAADLVHNPHGGTTLFFQVEDETKTLKYLGKTDKMLEPRK